MVSKEKIQQHKERLEKERVRLLKELEKSERPAEFGSDVDMDEETDEAEEFATKMAEAQALRDRINEIDSVLNRMAGNEYGICENCRAEISEEILETMPESKFCKNCKQAVRTD